jgi:hypothetical protein
LKAAIVAYYITMESSEGNSNGEGNDKRVRRRIPGTTYAQRLDWIKRNSERLKINYDSLPQLPSWGPLFGYGQDWFRVEIAEKVFGTSFLISRELTQDEIERISYYAAKYAATETYSPPMSILTAFILERRGRSSFRFPFYSPRPASFNPLFFPSAMMPILRGNMAPRAWHVTRFLTYGILAEVCFGPLVGSYAVSVYLASLLRDPHLASLRQEMLPEAERKRRGLASASQEGQNSNQQQYGGEMPTENEASQPLAKSTQQSSATSPWWSKQRPSQSPQVQQPVNDVQDDTDSLFDDDDASPVAASQRRQLPTSGGSSWDKIRNQAKTETNVKPQQASQSSNRSWAQIRGNASDTSKNSDYTYSQADEDRSYAKEQAQKEFDAMLERERKGDSDGRR